MVHDFLQVHCLVTAKVPVTLILIHTYIYIFLNDSQKEMVEYLYCIYESGSNGSFPKDVISILAVSSMGLAFHEFCFGL